MKYYCFLYYSTVAEHTLIGKLLTWLKFVIGSVLCWWRHLLFIIPQHSQRTEMPKQRVLFTFRPFELTRIDYKSYSKGMGTGINMYPKGRSGHRIAVNDTDLFCFGGTHCRQDFCPHLVGRTTIWQHIQVAAQSFDHLLSLFNQIAHFRFQSGNPKSVFVPGVLEI